MIGTELSSSIDLVSPIRRLIVGVRILMPKNEGFEKSDNNPGCPSGEAKARTAHEI